MEMGREMTFSIIAFDKKKGEIGIATRTKALACGGIVPAAEVGVGAVATQSYPNVNYKKRGIELLRKGHFPLEVVNKLTKEDDRREKRQVIVMNWKGVGAAYTGKENVSYADHIIRKDFACAGNMLANDRVIKNIANSFGKSKGKLVDRLFAALMAGEKAGGDKRDGTWGSASILIVKKDCGLLGIGDVYFDLRIDSSEDPLRDMKNLINLRKKIEHIHSKKYNY